MSDIAIDIANVAKCYSLSHRRRPDSLKAWLRGLLKRGSGSSDANAEEELWALKDLSLRVRQGECVALIGKNGSGKSTLLKILSRVITPSSGKIRVRGRVASLLEVGTGFHPELTGRENIFLNGAMLGCQEREISRRFDAIVDFSGVARFLDTPVKHYSSGMYVRLAYAVAAHVDADVLLIDEVLAVGDSEFQDRCLNHLEQLRTSGPTVIFVSHNPLIVERLATRIVRLENGSVVTESQALPLPAGKRSQ
jgi:lipopolysaccharide transport system ATP-binding protein